LQSAFTGQKIGVPEWPIDLPADLRAEWEVVTLAHHNILLAGTPCATSGMIASLMPHLRTPVHRYGLSGDGSVLLPTTGALIVTEVGALDLDRQLQLLQWLDRFHGQVPVQIVSTISRSLYPLVESGAFHDRLFYRLNIVRFDLSAPGEAVLL
jgi:sigma54-dependent transcription regulator